MSFDVATLLNGNILSAKSCQFFIDGVPIRGFTEVTYKDKLDTEDVHDDQRDGLPVGSTYGEYSVDSFSFTVLRATWLEIMTLLGTPNLGAYGSARFTFTAEYSEPLSPLQTVVDNLVYCRVVGSEDGYSQGIEKLVTKVDLRALGIMRNGIFTLFDPKRAFPV